MILTSWVGFLHGTMASRWDDGLRHQSPGSYWLSDEIFVPNDIGTAVTANRKMEQARLPDVRLGLTRERGSHTSGVEE